ncbi:MAG: cation:proton antiporter [Steroidobacteraceae bacterium]|jgi:Kef-type K+ transport system membrane component KefB
MNPPSLAGPHKTELLLFYTLLELAIIILAGRIGGTMAKRCGQSTAVGEIIVGILLGPSLFGWIAPRAFDAVFHSAPPEPLQVLSGLGLILLLFQIGMEFDFGHLIERPNRTAVLRVSAACLALPFACGFALGFWMTSSVAPPEARVDSALFVATAFSITALPILGRIMIELDLTRTKLGVIAIASAAANDVVGWLLLAFITALTVSNFDPRMLAFKVLMVAAFALISAKWVRPLLKRAVRRSNPRGGKMSANLLGGLLCVAFLGAMITYQIGIFAIFGGFMMGVILYDEPELVEAWRERVGGFVTVFFLPIFFTYTGLRTSIGSLGVADWGWCLAVVAAANISKFAAAYWAARRSRFNHAESSMIGYMMNTRALMELIVVNVGLDLGVIPPKVFTMLVIMAIVSTVITTPALKYHLARGGIDRLPLGAAAGTTRTGT